MTKNAATDIDKIRRQVLALTDQAREILEELEVIASHTSKLRHDQQSLRQALVAILDVLDHLQAH